MTGAVPPALRLRFGTKRLGLAYGALCLCTYASLLLWARLVRVSSDCQGVSCYRQFCFSGAAGTTVVMALGVPMLFVDGTRRRRGQAPPLLLPQLQG